jgi:hypothetical protein
MTTGFGGQSGNCEMGFQECRTVLMPFRFRRSTRLGSLRFNDRSAGLPGTGLSWSVESNSEQRQPAPAQNPAGPAKGLPNSLLFRPDQLDSFKQGFLGGFRSRSSLPDATAGGFGS